MEGERPQTFSHHSLSLRQRVRKTRNIGIEVHGVLNLRLIQSFKQLADVVRQAVSSVCKKCGVHEDIPLEGIGYRKKGLLYSQ